MSDRQVIEAWMRDHDQFFPPNAIAAARAGRRTYLSVSGQYDLDVPQELKLLVAE